MSENSDSKKKISSVHDLQVWQIGMEIVLESYKLSRKLPKEEMFGLTSQIRRAAVAIPANISEGFGRFSRPEFLQFLKVARGSIHELRTHFEITVHLEYFDNKDTINIFSKINEGDALITALMKSLSKPKKRD